MATDAELVKALGLYEELFIKKIKEYEAASQKSRRPTPGARMDITAHNFALIAIGFTEDGLARARELNGQFYTSKPGIIKKV